MKCCIVRFGFLFVLLFLVPAPGFAQNSISGIVFDENRKPVSEIDVELLDEFERYRTSTKTKGSGLYMFQGLSAGIYYIQVRVGGTSFKPQKERIQIGESNRTSRTTGASSGSESRQLNIYLQIDERRQNQTPLNNSVVFAQNVPAGAEQAYQNALENFGRKKPVEGIAGLLDAINIFPDYFLALDRLGNAYLEQGKFAEAEVFLKRAADVNPKSFSSVFGLSVAQNNLNKKEEAAENLGRAIELNQNSVSALLLLGIIQRDLKKYPEAEANLIRAKKISDNKEPDVHWNLALLYYYDLKKYDQAADELELYLKALPKDGEQAQKRAQIEKLIKTFREKAKKPQS